MMKHLHYLPHHDMCNDASSKQKRHIPICFTKAMNFIYVNNYNTVSVGISLKSQPCLELAGLRARMFFHPKFLKIFSSYVKTIFSLLLLFFLSLSGID